MNIVISNNKDAPIYEQIYEQIKNEILQNRIGADESLPSIRNLAKDLKVSVITTKRAYTELENDGYILTVPGKGSYVANLNENLINEYYLTELEKSLKEAIKLNKYCKLNKDEIISLIETLEKEVE
ncbi:MAG TPA: GntR family transcriptional regulator [Anaerovoracaceae bacterium]|nr:GntR family transcriptional regulator [Anaerovoracaceae bacterium]